MCLDSVVRLQLEYQFGWIQMNTDEYKWILRSPYRCGYSSIPNKVLRDLNKLIQIDLLRSTEDSVPQSVNSKILNSNTCPV